MATTTILLFLFYTMAASNAEDITGLDISRYSSRSNTVTVKYEGTEQGARELASSLDLEFKRKIFGDWYLFTIPLTNDIVPKDAPDIEFNLRKAKKINKKIKYIQQERYRKLSKRTFTVNDEQWPNQWHFQPSQNPSMNVYQVWEMGYTGKGITVAVVDDGVDEDNTDLIKNYNSSLSYDFIMDIPGASHKEEGEGHGTKVAGVVGAVKDTNCVIGVAYESTLTGIRCIGTTADDDIRSLPSIDAMCLVHMYEHIDIYSNSWGPEDDGVKMDTLEQVVNDAFELTIKEGRNGKGTIYTFASGNGGTDDSCGADAYSSNMYTISIAAVSKLGSPASYSEPCTSILAATYSGDDDLPYITTTGPDNTCVDDFYGTSAATPQASGIIALTLQANPDLTWRDIQHMIVEFSNQDQLVHSDKNYEFYTNGAGKKVSIMTGFGLMDAKAMVDNAPNWPSVPPRISCGSGDLFVDRIENDSTVINASYDLTDCLIQYVEHVKIHIQYNSSFRGDLELYLLSPMGTESKILSARPKDDTAEFTTHEFMSLHTWGEDPNGKWTLTMYPLFKEMELHLYKWGLEFFGTATDPSDGSPSDGTFGSPCNSTDDCTSVVDAGCLKDPKALCDNICISCKNGYHFTGDYCEKDCPPLAFGEGNVVELTYTQEGVIAKYTCNAGYLYIEGDLTRTCGDDGVWTGVEPLCDIDCGEPISPDKGDVSFSGTSDGFEAVYSCKDGYILTGGDDERYCLEDGKWNGSEPVCKIDCGPLEHPTYGHVSFNETFENEEAMYTCKDGYVLSRDDNKRVCQQDGNWSSADPVCWAVCCNPEPPAKGTVNSTSTLEGSTATYVCLTGYAISSGNALRTCTSDRNWNGTVPVCDIDCGPLYSPANGNVNVASTTKGSTVSYSCSNGFTVKSGDVLRACAFDGSWTGTKPVCGEGDATSVASQLNRSVIMAICVGILAVMLVVL